MCHVHPLENFTVDEIINRKHAYESFTHDYGNIVRKYRADNDRFSDNAFLNDIKASR